ncbi:hypothetical protein, partial [Pseudomonas moorei]
LLPRAARISTSRLFVKEAVVGFWVLSVTKKTPQRSIQTNPGGQQPVHIVARQANQWTLRGVSIDSYAYVFTCTYKHMQSSGQLAERAFKKNSEMAGKPMKQGFLALMIFFAGIFRVRARCYCNAVLRHVGAFGNT